MTVRIAEKQFRDLWLAGVPMEEMARVFGCNHSTIAYRASAMGLPKRKHGGSRKKAVEIPAEKSICVGKSLQENDESAIMSGSGGVTSAHPDPDHSEPEREVRTMADAASIAESRARSTRNISGSRA